MRIRKRPFAATSSGNLELHESSNGGHASSKSNPSFQDPQALLLSPPSIIMQDHSLLAGSGYGATHGLSQEQLPAEAVSLMTKPYIVVPSGVESCEDGKVMMMKNGEGNPRAKSVLDVQHHPVKHMHMHDGDDNVKGVYMKSCNELELQVRSSGKADKLAKACMKARHEVVCKGSALREEINVQADPAMVDTSDYPRKVRPLQLILSSDYSPSAPKLPILLCPTSSSRTLSCTTPPLPHHVDKALPRVRMKTPPLPSPAAGLLMKQIADVKSRDEMRAKRHEDARRCSRNNHDQSIANLVENRAELESCGLLQQNSSGPVSSWQGHRRPRSHAQGGRVFNGAPGRVNAVLQTEINDPTEQKRKKPKQTKIAILVSPCISPQAPTTPSSATAAGNGELRMKDCCPALNNNPCTKKTKNELLNLLSPSSAWGPPISTKMTGSLAAARLLEAKCARPTAAHTDDDRVASVAGADATDHGLELDSMRCRRKDGRRWRCKEQVVKLGAPFCHYHTLKMREKHAASVARKLLKQLQGEVKLSLSYADSSLSSKKRRKIRRSPSSSSIAVRGGDEEEENDNEGEQQAKLGKQQLVESLSLRRRWRKKCKPCIRRLHDIQDRAMPAATDGLDFLNPCAEDTYKDSPLVRSGSPLPECLLNTDPYEWRSDFP